MLAAVVSGATAAQAQVYPHLLPDQGPLAGPLAYDLVVGGAVDSLAVDDHSFAVDEQVVARVVRLYHLGSPGVIVVVVRKTPEGYVGLWAESVGSPWHDGFVDTGPASRKWSPELARKVTYRVGAVPVDQTLGRALGALWGLAILGTRYPAPDEVSPYVAMDGGSLYYARFIPYLGVASGWVRAASEGSPADELARLTGPLYRLLKHEDVATSEDVLRRVQSVLRAFDPEGTYRLAD